MIFRKKSTHKVALLATGDEVVSGDILNTNSQAIAQTLTQHNIQVGMHIACSDTQADIKHAIVTLLKNHDGLIITGGLGPTSDDRTRFALSAAIKKPLIFDETSWDHILTRIKRFTTRTPPDSNRQQALFPKGAVILENPNGTAAGCALYLQGKSIFMLPGPPTECLPMLESQVLPRLIHAKFQQTQYHKRWLLFGVSEGQIATELDLLVDPFEVQTGFRICYPYLEFKLHAQHESALKSAISAVKKQIEPNILGDGIKPVSKTLLQTLQTLDFSISIEDLATGGFLEKTLSTPQTYRYIQFHSTPQTRADLHITISGLKDYWQQNLDSKTSELNIELKGKIDKSIVKTIPCYAHKNLSYAVELIAFEILSAIKH